MRTHSLMARAEFGEDEFVEVNGYFLHYVEAGRGVPVLLIPGPFSTYRTWNPILPILAKQVRVLALDYLGTGDSDKPGSGFRYSIQEQADLIADLIRVLRLGKTHLVGASYGGAIAFNLAARHPKSCAKLIGIEGWIVRPPQIPPSLLEKSLAYPLVGDLAIRLIRAGWVDRSILENVAGEWRMTKAEKKRILEGISFATRSASRPAWHWFSKTAQTMSSFEEEASRIQAPILYLMGALSYHRETSEPTIRFLDEHLPHAKFLAFDDGIHALQFQKPDAVANAILSFLVG